MSTPPPVEDQAAEAPDLRSAALSGARWVGLSRIVVESAAIAGMLVLARVLPPAAFGHAVIATFFLSVAYTLTAEGFGSPIVQRKSVEKKHIQTAAALSLLLGAVGMGLGLAVSEFVIRPVLDPETADLTAIMSGVWLIAALHTVPTAILQRHLAFKTLAISEAAAGAVNTATSVTLALSGVGSASLVIGPMAGSATAMVIATIAARPPFPKISRGTVREIAAFGIPAQLSGLTYTATRNIDYLLLSFVVGPTQTGYYTRAYQLGVEYQNKIGAIMLRIAFPLYSRTASQDQMNQVQQRVMQVYTATVFPLLGILFVTAPVLVPLMFGPQWDQSIEPTQLLAIAGMAVSVNLAFSPVLLAAGRPRQAFATNLVSLILTGGMVALLAPHGIAAVAAGCIPLNVILTTGIVEIPLRSLGIRGTDVLRGVAPLLLMTAVMICVGSAVLPAVDAHLAALPTLFVTSAACLVTYFAALRLVPDVNADVSVLLNSIAGRLRPARG